MSWAVKSHVCPESDQAGQQPLQVSPARSQWRATTTQPPSLVPEGPREHPEGEPCQSLPRGHCTVTRVSLSLRLTVRDLVTHWPNDSSCCGSQSCTTRPSLTRCGHTNDGDRPPGGPGDTAQLEAPPGGSKGPLVQEGPAGLEGASHGCPHAAPSTWRATCQGLEPETQARSRAAGTVGA